VGKTLEVTADGSFNIITGSEAYAGELLKGQKLEVVGVQEGGWLQCKLISPATFYARPPVQGSDAELTEPPDSRPVTGEGILWGVSLNFDKDKFRVVESQPATEQKVQSEAGVKT